MSRRTKSRKTTRETVKQPTARATRKQNAPRKDSVRAMTELCPHGWEYSEETALQQARRRSQRLEEVLLGGDFDQSSQDSGTSCLRQVAYLRDQQKKTMTIAGNKIRVAVTGR